ncbi:hypothetical protein [Weissella hellenica]|uniref:hypothetical protein n=1 Tax=Weissella hellenica TaxID=46256 RepID=UPI001D17886F|nr:hypothetical protein GZH44_07415 [Weissella hellenica]
MNFSDMSLVFQAMWLIIKYIVWPVLVVSGALWLVIEYWEAIKYCLRISSRIISLAFLMLAWLIIRLIDGKEAADKRI